MNIYLGGGPSHWRRRSVGNIAARVLTAIGLVAIMTFLWLAVLEVVFWVVGL